MIRVSFTCHDFLNSDECSCKDVVNFIYESNECGLPTVRTDSRGWCDLRSIFCVDMLYLGSGDVVGTGDKRLRIAGQNGNHFVPLN